MHVWMTIQNTHCWCPWLWVEILAFWWARDNTYLSLNRLTFSSCVLGDWALLMRFNDLIYFLITHVINKLKFFGYGHPRYFWSGQSGNAVYSGHSIIRPFSQMTLFSGESCCIISPFFHARTHYEDDIKQQIRIRVCRKSSPLLKWGIWYDSQYLSKLIQDFWPNAFYYNYWVYSDI